MENPSKWPVSTHIDISILLMTGLSCSGSSTIMCCVLSQARIDSFLFDDSEESVQTWNGKVESVQCRLVFLIN